MDLFIMNRYLGEEGDKNVKKSDHLAQLLAKVEERKRKRTVLTSKETVKPTDTVIDETNTSSIDISDHTGVHEKKKKKKGDKKLDDSVENEGILSAEHNIQTLVSQTGASFVESMEDIKPVSGTKKKKLKSNDLVIDKMEDSLLLNSSANQELSSVENKEDETTIKVKKKKRKQKVSDNTKIKSENEEPVNHTDNCSSDKNDSEISICKKEKKKKIKLPHKNVEEIGSSEEVTGRINDTKLTDDKENVLKTEDSESMTRTDYCTSDKNDSEISTDKKHKKKVKRTHEDSEEIGNSEEVIGRTDETNLMSGKENSLEPEGFTVLGGENFRKKAKMKSILPYWLAHPQPVSRSLKDLEVTINDIRDLDEDLREKLKENNITHFFPVQCQVIPWLLTAYKKPIQYRPQDICVSAPTGSGKSLAFVLPIIQILKTRLMHHIRALVLLPVQELAAQVYEVFKTYSKGTDLRVTLLSSQNVFQKEQELLVKTSPIIGKYSVTDIVVATPGRLVDHLTGTPGFSLSYLQFLVIDEADRIMDNVQNDWLYHVEKHIRTNKPGCHTFLTVSSLQSVNYLPQKLLFSATLSQDPEKLQQLNLFQPKLFSVAKRDVEKEEQKEEDSLYENRFIGKYTTPDELTEKFCVVDPEYKPLALYHLITSEKWQRVLCFTNSQINAHRLAILLKFLDPHLQVDKISSTCSHKERNMIMKKFSDGEINVLVSSDALARGIDFPAVDYVVSYDVPMYLKTYIHRIGRTARAGKVGTAVSLVLQKEFLFFKNMLQIAARDNMIEFSVQEKDLEYLEEDYKTALGMLKHKLEKEKITKTSHSYAKKNFKIKNKKRNNGSN